MAASLPAETRIPPRGNLANLESEIFPATRQTSSRPRALVGRMINEARAERGERGRKRRRSSGEGMQQVYRVPDRICHVAYRKSAW